jgi:hypothetical protein
MYGTRQGDWRQGSLGAQFELIQHEAILAISEAHTEATAAQYAQGSTSNDTYGHTLKVRQHELLNARLKKVPGIVLRRPEGVSSRFKFPVIEETNTVLVPLRFSNDPRVRHDDVTHIDLSDLRRALLAGPTPPEEPTLLEMAAGDDYEARYQEELAAFEQLVTAGRAIVIGYGSTPEGIFEIGLGELSVDDADTGAISWRRWHRLPVYADLAAVPVPPALRTVAPVAVPERFDAHATSDDLGLRLRPIGEPVPNAEGTRGATENAEDSMS